MPTDAEARLAADILHTWQTYGGDFPARHNIREGDQWHARVPERLADYIEFDPSEPPLLVTWRRVTFMYRTETDHNADERVMIITGELDGYRLEVERRTEPRHRFDVQFGMKVLDLFRGF